MVQDKAQSATNGHPLVKIATQDWAIWGAPFGRDDKRPSTVLRFLSRGRPLMAKRALYLAVSRLADIRIQFRTLH